MAYVLTMSLVLGIFAIYISAFFHQRLHAEIAHDLDLEINSARHYLQINKAGKMVWHTPETMLETELPLKNVSWMDIHQPNGTLLYRVPESGLVGTAAEIPAFDKERTAGSFSLTTQGDIQYRILQRDINIAGQMLIIRVAILENRAEEQLRILHWVIWLGLPLALLISAVGGFYLAGHALAPMSKFSEKARSITAEQLNERLPVTNSHDELDILAETFNDLFSRLQSSFENLKRCSADASHEIRTPLSIIRSVGEVGLRKNQDEEGYREAIGTMLEEADRLTMLTDSLLDLMHVEGLQSPLDARSFDLTGLAEEVVGQINILAEVKGQSLSFKKNSPVIVTGNRSLLYQVIVNILDNAIKYTQQGGWVNIKVEQTDNEALLEINDNGPGIHCENQNRIFERFYREDVSRNRNIEGFGLGLAFAKRVVEIHGGRIEISNLAQSGSVFRVVLPLAGKPHQS